MSSLKKILVIPSWYPSEEKPYSGIFFKIQAKIFENSPHFDLKILPYSIRNVGKKDLAKRFLKADLKAITKTKDIAIDLDKFEIHLNIENFPSLTKKHRDLFRIKKLYLSAIRKMIQFGWKPDLIHAHDINWGGSIAKYLHDKLDLPYIVTQHSPIFFNYMDDFMRDEFSKAFKSAKQVLAVSSNDARLLDAAGLSNNIQTVGNLINENLFLLKEGSKQEDKFVIFTVGSLSYRKDYPTFVKAINHLINDLNQKDMEVIINYIASFEDNFSLPELLELIKQYSLESFCTIIKGCSLEQMPAYYHNASVYIQTSIYETFGVAVVEALMCGVPVVATDNGGIQDIYDGKNMILKKNHDYIGIAEAIYAIKQKDVVFDSTDLRNSVINKFGTDAFKERIGNIYSNNLDTMQHD